MKFTVRVYTVHAKTFAIGALSLQTSFNRASLNDRPLPNSLLPSTFADTTYWRNPCSPDNGSPSYSSEICRDERQPTCGAARTMQTINFGIRHWLLQHIQHQLVNLCPKINTCVWGNEADSCARGASMKCEIVFTRIDYRFEEEVTSHKPFEINLILFHENTQFLRIYDYLLTRRQF